MKPKILFVCGRNKWRSPTAARIYRNDPRVDVRSAGMSGKSPHPISNSDLEWADLVLVMERRYKGKLMGLFRDLELPPIESLDIPDEYEYMDEELVDLIRSGVEHHINNFAG
jgi:protein-tyrosine phosphatase